MAGERALRFIDLGTRGTSRLLRRMAVVTDRYAPEPMQEMAITFEDAMRELDERGHLFDPTCTSPFCVQAGMLIQGALAAFTAEQQAMEAGSGGP